MTTKILYKMPVKEEILYRLLGLHDTIDNLRKAMHRVLHPDACLGSLGFTTIESSVSQTRLALQMISNELDEIERVVNEQETPEEVKNKAYENLNFVNRESTCKKCGCAKATIALKTQSPKGNWYSSVKEVRDLFEKYSYCLIERQCTDCNFIWYEKPLDEKKDTRENPEELRVGTPVSLVNKKLHTHNIVTEEGNRIALVFNEDTRFVIDSKDTCGIVLRTCAPGVKIKIGNENDIERITYD